MKIRRTGDLVVFDCGDVVHTVRRTEIKRVTYSAKNGRISIEIPGEVIVTRLMDCLSIKAKDSRQLYDKICELM